MAAENGCVEMLEMLMDEYDMATMKPNKVCVDLVCLHLTILRLLMHKRVWLHIYEFHL